MKFHTPETYAGLPIIALPLTVDTLEITEMKCSCSICGQNLIAVRGNIRHHPNCYDFDLAGVCQPCQAIVSVRFRWYTDEDRVIAVNRSGAWREIRRKRSWLAPIRRLLNRLFHVRFLPL